MVNGTSPHDEIYNCQYHFVLETYQDNSQTSKIYKMTVIHIGMPLKPHLTTPSNCPVLFKFRADVDEAHRQTFINELKTLKTLSCVKDQRLVVGGPSITDPIARSKGYQICLLSFHPSPSALAEYQASSEHHR